MPDALKTAKASCPVPEAWNSADDTDLGRHRLESGQTIYCLLASIDRAFDDLTEQLKVQDAAK